MNEVAPGRNIDTLTVAGFGEEWDSFDQSGLDQAEWEELFTRYFAIFPCCPSSEHLAHLAS